MDSSLGSDLVVLVSAVYCKLIILVKPTIQLSLSLPTAEVIFSNGSMLLYFITYGSPPDVLGQPCLGFL